MKGPVILDKQNGSISFNLPEEALDYSGQLGSYLQQMFAYESMTAKTVKEMNSAAIEWLKNKGINTNWDNSEENADGN